MFNLNEFLSSMHYRHDAEVPHMRVREEMFGDCT